MPIDDAGRVLNGKFSVEIDGPYLALILDSAGGRSSSGSSRNLDYPTVLTLLLTRLRDRDATVHEALLDSRRTQHLPEEDRRLSDGPMRLKDWPDMDFLRLELTRRQGRVGQAPSATRDGNNRKRMRLRLEVPGFAPSDANRLASELAGHVAAEEPATGSHSHPAPRPSETLHNREEGPDEAASDSPRHLRYVQDARLRQAIEKHAVNRAIKHYEDLGYHVEDVGTRRSYDLHAVMGTTVLHIEVKGSAIAVNSVELTTNEVDNAREHLTDLVVVDQINLIDNGGEVPDLEGGRVRIWERWQPADEDLRPTRFDYRISKLPTFRTDSEWKRSPGASPTP
ncbi:DUF3883 domain-containing protein [Nonomuraea sp. NPDC049649]|uniref:protein NO VEIN domain-containing protein n=1 Tax=Nonomuraea sp. NPDC049649 TaxID=3155776 RepID=UPI00343DE048